MEGDKACLPDIDGAFMYRITLPEWMVEARALILTPQSVLIVTHG